MRLFITGGSGYLGDVLANKLSSLYSITSLSQKYIPSKNKNKNIQYKKVNYKSLESLKKTLKGADIVIHLVGMNKEECKKKKIKV